MKKHTDKGFTLIELLTVIAIIAILMGLVIGVAGMVSTKASRDRAGAEIHALSTAMESYKADNGIYPQDVDTDTLDPKAAPETGSGKTTKYMKSTFVLYKALSGDDDGNFRREGTERDNKVYFEFETKKGMIGGKKDSNNYITEVYGIVDPWGDAYGYSTIYAYQLQQGTPNPPDKGYNPTFDLWSIANAKKEGDTEAKWVKNW